jgi:hypothetical protein
MGTNGSYSSGTTPSIGGTLWVAAKAQMDGDYIGGDLLCGEVADVWYSSHVKGDAYLVNAPAILGGETFTIDGDLHLQTGKNPNGAVVHGSVISEDVTVPAPCNCASPIDIAALVTYFKDNNDNAIAGLSQDALAAAGGLSKTLGHGRYFLNKIGGHSDPMILTLTGRTAIFVEGDIGDPVKLTVRMSSHAELDLFVAGSVTGQGDLKIGDTSRAAATRIYVAGSFLYNGSLVLAANVYVPHGPFSAPGTRETWGAVFADQFRFAGSVLKLHYDEAVLGVEGCMAADQACMGCHDCANPTPACVSGTCAACRKDSDCCPPLRCELGACVVR